MQLQHDHMIAYLRGIEQRSFQEWDRIREHADSHIASLLKRIYDTFAKAFRESMDKQMRAAVSYDLHSRLLSAFPSCFYSLDQLRIRYPFFDGDNFHFALNFDTFAGPRAPRLPEAGFGLCLSTMMELEKFSIDFKQKMNEAID